MPFVKAPNGDVYELSDSVASGLIGAKNNGWSAVKAPKGQAGGKSEATDEAEVLDESDATEEIETTEETAEDPTAEVETKK